MGSKRRKKRLRPGNGRAPAAFLVYSEPRERNVLVYAGSLEWMHIKSTQPHSCPERITQTFLMATSPLLKI